MRDAVQLRYANDGFRNATVSSNPGLSADGTRADIVFTVEEGPQVFVDHVLIVGNQRTNSETIRRELQFRSGDPLGLAAVTESQRRLATLGLFRRVRITELGHGVETVARRAGHRRRSARSRRSDTVADWRPANSFARTRRRGASRSARIEFAPRAFFEIGRRNLFGKNRSVNLFTRISLRPRDFQEGSTETVTGSNYGFSEYRVLGTYREPRVFGTAADAFLTGTIEQQTPVELQLRAPGFSAELLRRV